MRKVEKTLEVASNAMLDLVFFVGIIVMIAAPFFM